MITQIYNSFRDVHLLSMVDNRLIYSINFKTTSKERGEGTEIIEK